MFSVLRKRLVCFTCNTNFRVLLPSIENRYGAFTKLYNIKYVTRTKATFKAVAQREGPQPSRYHPGSWIDITDEYIISTIGSQNTRSSEEWEDFKTNLMLEAKVVNEENFASIVMNCLLFANKLELAHSFMKYLEQSYMEPNFLAHLKYIALCGRNHRQVNEELILQSFNKVKSLIDQSVVLDRKTIGYVIQGLCATHKWRDSFKYLKKLHCKPGLDIHTSLASAAVRNGDQALAWEILMNWMKGETPDDRVIEEFLLVALKMQKIDHQKADIFIQRLLQYMERKDVIINQDTVKHIECYFTYHRLKWSISYAKANREGYCEKCEHSLKLLDLTNEDFEYLKRAFLERSVKKSDVYINTSPREFNKYLQFIERNKPFHIVIDGLNAAHTCPRRKTPKNLAFHLMDIVKHLASKSRKVLILGRNHMKSWPSFPMQKIAERAEFFFTDNTSQDDPYVIYSALASGPHTCFVSGDLMRDHTSRLDDTETIHLFNLWLQSHRILVTVDENKAIQFTKPVRHRIGVQGSMGIGWHIPFDDKIILDPYEELNNWLCIQKDL